MALQRVPFGSWPEHVRTVFVELGKAMRSDRLYPEALLHMPAGDGAILPGHRVEITHISGAQLEKRKGRYVIQIDGPIFAGSWGFSSGELEALARQARASGDISDAADIASAMLDGRLGLLQGARSLMPYLDPALPIWEAANGARGPLAMIYAACDEADRIGFIGNNLDAWHPDVRARKQSELAAAEERFNEPIRSACQAIIAFAASRAH